MKTFLTGAMFAVAMTTVSVIPVSAPAVAASKVAPASIVIVDMDRIVNESAAGKQAATEIQQKVNQLQTRGQALQTQLRAEAETIQKGQQNKSLQGAALEQKVQAFQTRQESARKELGTLEGNIQNARQYVMKQITDAANPIITGIMQERGASIALAQDAAIQHSAALDVTTDVITKLNASLPRVSTTPPAASSSK